MLIMKKPGNLLFLILFCLCSCSKMKVDDANISIASPQPTEQIEQVSLTAAQRSYVDAGNRMAFKFLNQVFLDENIVVSPLSLQYAMAMAANGASSETLQEIVDFLGYGSDGIDALNEYSKILMEQLPAVDLDMTLNVVNAILVNEIFPVLPSYKNLVETNYYAAVESMNFSDPANVANRINEWADKSTNGFIDEVIEPGEVNPSAAAFILNALYFKAQWEGYNTNPMFLPDLTKAEDFFLSDGSTARVKMMRNARFHQYAEMDGYKVLVLPYAQGKFNMYILLPDENNIGGLIEKLQSTSWSDIIGNLKQDAKVYVRLPKFDVENKLNLSEVLKSLGVKRAFDMNSAQFDRMLSDAQNNFWIYGIIQKSRIAVSEWGTEAASVTFDGFASSGEPGGDNNDPKEIYFYADHPFVFIIGEETSGTILFEGVYTHP